MADFEGLGLKSNVYAVFGKFLLWDLVLVGSLSLILNELDDGSRFVWSIFFAVLLILYFIRSLFNLPQVKLSLFWNNVTLILNIGFWVTVIYAVFYVYYFVWMLKLVLWRPSPVSFVGS